MSSLLRNVKSLQTPASRGKASASGDTIAPGTNDPLEVAPPTPPASRLPSARPKPVPRYATSPSSIAFRRDPNSISYNPSYAAGLEFAAQASIPLFGRFEQSPGEKIGTDQVLSQMSRHPPVASLNYQLGPRSNNDPFLASSSSPASLSGHSRSGPIQQPALSSTDPADSTPGDPTSVGGLKPSEPAVETPAQKKARENRERQRRFRAKAGGRGKKAPAKSQEQAKGAKGK